MSFHKNMLVELYATQIGFIGVINAAFLFFETSKLWVLFMYICILDGKPKD
jgi:hypothetical protein